MINPTLNHYPEIASYLKQNFAHYDINYIACGRVYRDGRYYHIASNPSWVIDHVITQKLPPSGLINFDELSEKQLIYSTEKCDRSIGWPEGVYLNAREKFNIKNLLAIIIKKHDYTDQFFIDIHNSDAINIYLNHLGIIENIFKNVKYQFNNLINHVAKEPLIIENKYLSTRTLKQQLQHVSEGSFILCYKEKYIKLTKQEHNCLKNLAKGLRQKAIATKLNISARTVETHLSHIRTKLGLDTAELITCYWENQEITS